MSACKSLPMADYRATTVPGIYVRHALSCPAAAGPSRRCRCRPSYRAKRRDLGWSPTFKSRDQAAEWKSSAAARAALAREPSEPSGPTFEDVARAWWDGVESGAIGKRKGRKADGYSATTLAGYRRTLFNVLLPTFGDEPAAALDEARWQTWVDGEARAGLSRSRIANHLSVASAVYGWAARPTRRIVPRNPTTAVELPPNDEKPRDRVATTAEAAELMAALGADARPAYALAFYAGLRRSEIQRLEWRDVDLSGLAVTVRRSKTEAGTGRVVPIAAPLVSVIEAAKARPSGRPAAFVTRSVMSGKLAARARKAWRYVDHEADEPKHERAPPLKPIGLHECRHTYASLLVAAGYTLKEVMAYLGHADLTTTSRYVKQLPQPNERNRADRLNEYLAA
jgi:integrase